MNAIVLEDRSRTREQNCYGKDVLAQAKETFLKLRAAPELNGPV